ncbi:hypothetical protein ACIQXQ_20040 [Peribacillus sp. NPDC097198]|uniref:hypothetical protein n=1 Tax=Peribacillus sp. NPDC097198 TaxID=3364397 RepID=UPI0037FC3EE4
MVTKNDLIFIYDAVLSKKIKKDGYTFLLSAYSLSDRRFWVYPRIPEIEEIMKEHAQL